MVYCGAMENKESIDRRAIRNILTRDFILAFFAFFTFMTALYALIPTLPIYLNRLGSSVSEIGIIIGVYGIASLICRFVVGGVLTRYSVKMVMIIGAVFSIISFLASLILRPFWPFFAIRFFQGAAMAFLDTAVLTFVVNVTPQAYRGQGIAYLLLAPSLAMVVAPALGMLLINRYSFTVLFLSCAVLSACSLFFSWKIDAKKTVRPEKTASVERSFYLEWKIIVPGVSSFLQNFIYGAVCAFVTLYAIQYGVANPGLFFSASAVMMIAGRMFGGRILDTYSKEKIILLFVVMTIIDMVILSFATTLPMFVLAGLIWGIGTAFFYPACMAYSLEFVGSSSGTVLGTLRAIMDLGLAVGPMAMGFILPFTGYPTMFLCLALTAFINLCYFQFYVRKKRSQHQ
jgi:MFS family permease